MTWPEASSSGLSDHSPAMTRPERVEFCSTTCTSFFSANACSKARAACSRARGGTIRSQLCPIASSRLWPKIFSAAGFHSTISDCGLNSITAKGRELAESALALGAEATAGAAEAMAPPCLGSPLRGLDLGSLPINGCLAAIGGRHRTYNPFWPCLGVVEHITQRHPVGYFAAKLKAA